MFHKIYSEAEQELNDFNSIVLPWDVHPDRDDEWFEKECRNMSAREIAQELQCNFNMSGETLLSGEDMKRVEESIKEPIYKTGFDRGVWLWEAYNSENKYFLVADVARGDGQDNSTFLIFNSDTMECVGEYCGKLPIDMFAPLIFETSKEYGFCLTVVENNSIGMSVLDKLIEMNHPNLYWSRKGTHEHVDQHLAEQQTTAKPGFTTTSKTRPLIVAKLEELIRNKVIKTYSRRLLNEYKTFVWSNGRPAAMRGYNDDLVMAAAIACWVRETALVVNQRDVAYKKAMLNSFVKTNTSLNTNIKGMKGYKKDIITKFSKDVSLKTDEFPFFIR